MTISIVNPVKHLKNVPLRVAANLNVRLLATAVLLFVIFMAGLSYVQYGTPALAGNDGYYHIKMGYLIRTQGLTPSFPYLPTTILNEAAFYDHHLLYHVYLALFAHTDPAVDGGLGLTQGAKLASVIMPALAGLAIWWLLRTQRVPYAALWAVGFLGLSDAFLYRMSMPRAQSASLLLLVLGLHWLLHGRYKALLPLGFLYVWFYNAFPLLLVMAGVYLVATFMLERRFVWQALVYPMLGIGLGLVINPYFPVNLEFIMGHLAPKLGTSATRVGNEWSPYQTLTLLENSGVTFILVLLGILAIGWQEKRLAKNTLVALGLTTLLGYMLFESRRFIEYFPPFALIFFAFSVAPLLRQWQRGWQQKEQLHLIRLFPILVAVLWVYPLYMNLTDGQDLMARSKASDYYADAAIWLNQNAPPGSHIFQTDWDDFTRLFFYNSSGIYTAGLDPTFMELYDEDLFEEWVAITQGDVEMPGRTIREDFGSQYIFSDLNHRDFLAEAEVDPLLEEVYRDDYAVIFAVR